MHREQWEENCRLCEHALGDSKLPIQEKHRLAFDIDVCLINKCERPCIDSKEKRRRRSVKTEELIQKVSALKNSGGGAVLVHIKGIARYDRCFAYFNEYVDDTLTNLNEDGHLFVDTYRKVWLSDDESSPYSEILLVTVKGSTVLSTADFKTKVTSDENITRPTSRNVALLLFGKKRSCLPPKIRGIDEIHQEGRQIQFKYFDHQKFGGTIQEKDIETAVQYVWKDLRLREYLTTFSKVHGGGSFFLGIAERDVVIETQEKKYTTKGSVKRGIEIPICLHKKFLSHLQKKINDNIFIYPEADFLPELYKAKFHKIPPTNPNSASYVLEVAIGSVTGCVFYEKTGPEAYRIQDNGVMVELSFDDWLSKIKETKKLHGKEILGKWPSNSQFPFHFIQEKNSFQDIQEYILKKENLTIFVTKTFEAGDEVVISKLHERLEDLGKGLSKGMVHVTKCLTILLNLDPIEIPKGILWELFCCLPDRPCTLLFLVTSTSNNALKTYSLNLTRNALCKMRKFTDEHFSIIYGLITENDLQSKESFVACLEKIEEETSVFCNPDSLQMTVEKCKNITKAFLASIASTDLVTILKDEEADKDTLWFLTLQQFCVLVENIDEEVVYLESVPGSGGTFILTEVARRLCKIGNTVLSIERELKETISRKNVVSLVVSPEKLHKVNLIDFKHIVAEGVSLEVEGLKSEAPNRIKVWLLNSQNAAAASQEVNKQQQGQQHTPGSHPQDAETVEIRDRGHDGDDDNGVDEEGYCSAVTDSDEDMYFSTNEDELNLAQGTWIKRKSCEIFERSKKEICSQVSNTASSHMEAVVKKRLKDRSTLSIIGFPGEGKTTLACQVLMDYLKEDWKVYILHEPQEYFCLELKDKCIILFKDIFGQANFDEECYKKWASVLNDIVWQAFHVPKQYRVLYTLFLFRKDIFQKAWTHSTTYNVLFKHELDVHNMDILDIPEKETIVKKGQSESESESEQISKRLAEKSPLLLRMYSLMSTKPSTLREFSMDPEPYLIQTVNSLVKNEEYLRTFRLLIHHDNIPDLTQIENNYSVVKHLCESAGLLTVRPKSILNVVNVLDGLIINRSNGYITFCHSRISEIVASVLSKHDSNHYIEYCSLTHLAYTHPPIFDELNPPHSIEIENKVAPVLGRRLVSEVKKGNVKFVLVHVALSNPEVEAVMLANTEGLLYVRDIKSGMCFLELLPYCWSKRMQKWALKENILSDQILKIMYTCCCCGNIKLLHDLLHKYQGLFMSQIHLSQNPVTVSAQWNNTEVCRLLLKHLDVNSQDGDGNTALHHASANGNISLVNDLMHMKKIQCDVVNKRGETPLHKAVYHRQDNVAEMLLHAGANPHLRDNTGMTVLLAAAASGATDVITELLERESDIMDTDIHGNTVIHIAAHFGHDSLVQRLTQTSLNISQTNHSGMTHLHIAARNGKHLAVKHLLDAEMGKSRRRVSIHGDDKKETQELVRSQSLNTQDNFGMTPLHYASMWGHIVVIGTLLTHKCNVCSTTNSGQTALHLAAENGHIQATKTLTEHGSDVNAQDELGRTPLHAAVSRGNVKVVKCLLRGNADVRIRDKCGRTALELAKHQKRKPVLQVFKRHVNHEKSNDFSRSEHERGEKERPNCKSIVGGILGVVAAVFICYYLKWQ